jgi:hypothetical protein
MNEKEEATEDFIQIHIFSEVSDDMLQALATVEKQANDYLADILASNVKAIHLEQTHFTDKSGDYPRQMFWPTVLITVRVPGDDPGPDDNEHDEIVAQQELEALDFNPLAEIVAQGYSFDPFLESDDLP